VPEGCAPRMGTGTFPTPLFLLEHMELPDLASEDIPAVPGKSSGGDCGREISESRVSKFERRGKYICYNERLVIQPLYFHWSIWNHRIGYPGTFYRDHTGRLCRNRARKGRIRPLRDHSERGKYISCRKKSAQAPLYFHWSPFGCRIGHPGAFLGMPPAAPMTEGYPEPAIDLVQ
jgi:hypothetical protein